MDPLARFGPATAGWFRQRYGAATPVQTRGWDAIAGGQHAVLCAPTGSGKTLAAFLWCIDGLLVAPAVGPVRGIRAVYVSPLRALAYDVERNLNAPLAEIGAYAAAHGHPLGRVAVDVRTGDTSAKERARQRRDPAPILVTTPESLFLLLGSQAKESLRTVDTVIVDEVHVLAGSKRGAHLALTLERLSQLVESSGRKEPQRIALSATQRPLDTVARYLAGRRPVAIVDAATPPALEVRIEYPQPAPELAAAPSRERGSEGGRWPAIDQRLLELVLAHRSTIIFVASRRLAERLAQRLSDRAALAGAPPELALAHHGSMARARRLEVEERLKAGLVRALVATGSLELGIDMGAVDLVVQIGSPQSVSRALQRIGRAGHQVGAASSGVFLPTHGGELAEAAAIVRGMRDGAVEPLAVPDGCLDVLAQQLVAICAEAPTTVAELERLVTAAGPYQHLSRAALHDVLGMLAGRGQQTAELRPRLSWDRSADLVSARRGAKLLVATNAGTIPDRGLFAVVDLASDQRVGELDEEMVYESRAGETFVLGASTWRIEAIERDRVLVSAAAGEPGKMPFWRGEAMGRPIEVGRALGELERQLGDALAVAGDDPARRARLERDLGATYQLDAAAATALVAYLAEQRAATGVIPSDRAITVEHFRDEVGDWRICILSPFGARVHTPWALALEQAEAEAQRPPLRVLASNDGLTFRIPGDEPRPDPQRWFPGPDAIAALVAAGLARAPIFAARFREAAARALLLPRRRPGARTPLWTQRLRAQQLFAVAAAEPRFPMVVEALRECMQDVFDLEALREILSGVVEGGVAVDAVETRSASPFARSLVYDYTAAFLYEGDAPAAERAAQAVSLDPAVLRDLFGAAAAAPIDPEVAAELEAELQHTVLDRRARDADEVGDLLRELGDLDQAEVAARSDTDAAAALTRLEAQQQAQRVEVAGTTRWISRDDAARLAAVLVADPDALDGWVQRALRGRVVTTAAELAARWALPVPALEASCQRLAMAGHVQRVGDAGYCDASVWRRLRGRTAARLRARAAPVDAAAVGRFLPRWHRVGSQGQGLPGLREALLHLEGAALSFAELESRYLPARIRDYHPRLLDELGAAGELTWQARGPLGRHDGKVVIARRHRAATLFAAATLPQTASPLAARIHDLLRGGGASFLVALESATGAPRAEVRAALWELVWAGLVTNDTFAPLRSLRQRGAAVRSGAGAWFGGRWAVTTAPAVHATQRLHGAAIALLDRWGLVTSEAASADGVAWTSLVAMFRALEDAGRARRGHFVSGLAGHQVAWPAAVEMLRDGRPSGVVALAATDPANPYGALLPWPEREGARRLARRGGACVVLVEGELALYWESRQLVTCAVAPEARVQALALGPPAIARLLRRRELPIDRIDDVPARQTAAGVTLIEGGARIDLKGLVVAVA